MTPTICINTYIRDRYMNTPDIVSTHQATVTQTDSPLRDRATGVMKQFFANLNGQKPANVYKLALREMEMPLFEATLKYTKNNQSKAAIYLGISRGTFRKKLTQYQMMKSASNYSTDPQTEQDVFVSGENNLRTHVANAMANYYANLDGHKPAKLYQMVLEEVEIPLIAAMMNYTNNNQSTSAKHLGISRGTFRKKLAQYDMMNTKW